MLWWLVKSLILKKNGLLQGFKEFLKTASAAQIPNSNLFANSKNPQKDYEVDVVKLALGGENE